MQKSTASFKKQKKLIVIIILILLLGLCAVLLWHMSTQPKEPVQDVISTEPIDYTVTIDSPIHLSETAHFYNTDISVAITVDHDADIYYTLDGTPPDQNATRYTQPILFQSTSDTNCYPLRVVAYSKQTEPVTLNHTYLIGESIDSRFDTYVFSITVDPTSLWDYEYGIFTGGKIMDEYLAAHPGESVYWGTPANYTMRGRASERSMYLEAFTPDGTCIISQDAGMRTYGGASRSNAQKSVKLYARAFYDADNKDFTYPFFSDVMTPDGSLADSYTRLVLRNCGNDHGYAFIRDELIQRLAKAAGYQDTEAVAPCALFINGTYYGFYWLHENYGGTYFENHYGDYQGDFVVLEGGELYKSKSDASEEERDQDDDLQDSAVDEYNEIYNQYSGASLHDEAIYEELCAQIDVENYLKYYALNLYFDNTDWPMNNYKLYRYYASDLEGDGYVEGTAFDGKWRYLPHDIDYTLALYGASHEHTEFLNIMETAGTSNCIAPLFAALMQRTDCRNLFLTQIVDLANGFASGDTISDTLDAMGSTRANELSYSYTSGLLPGWVTPEQLEPNLQRIADYGYARAPFMLDLLADYYNFGLYTLQITAPESSHVMVNSYPASTGFTGNYYRQLDTVLTPDPTNADQFSHWLVNGVTYSEPELIITQEMIDGDTASIELVVN